MVFCLKRVAAAGALALVSGIGLAASGESVAKGLRAGAIPAKKATPVNGVSPSAAADGSATAIWTGLEPVVAVGMPAQLADFRQTAAVSRGTPAGRAVQGAGRIAAATTTAQSVMRLSGEQGDLVATEPGPAGETDAGALVLAGLGVMGFLALRRKAVS